MSTAAVRPRLDFFEAQDHARRVSRRLVALYALAVTALIGGVYLAVAALSGFLPFFSDGPALETGLFHPELFAAVAAGMLLLIGGGTLFRTAQLRRGGPAVARLLGGRPVNPSTTDPLERRLLNVVEEMSIAAGLPLPAVFVLEAEEGMNAFAAGHTVHDAAVVVTRGLLRNLSRDELQGVVAHEFSHILNGDMRLNVRLMGLLYGIFLLTVVGRGIARGAVRERRTPRSFSRMQVQGGGQIALVGLALVVLGYIGVLVGRLIQAAVSRQREFLADAAAVEFTRNPAGLAGALKKIAAWTYGSRLADHHAEEASHLFFAPGSGGALAGLVATHPPLEERIRRLDPHWDGRLEGVEESGAWAEGRHAPPRTGRPAGADAMPWARPPGAPRGVPGVLWTPARSGPGPQEAGRGPARARQDPAPALPREVFPLVATAGSLDPGRLAHARSLLDEIPAELKHAVRTPEGALRVVLALLGGPQGESGGRSPAAPAGGSPDPSTLRRTPQPELLAAGLPPHLRLPLLELAASPLRHLPPAERQALPARLAGLIRADGRILPFEFAAYHVVCRALEAGGEGGRAPRSGQTPLGRLVDEVSVLLSALAWAGAGGAGDGEQETAPQNGGEPAPTRRAEPAGGRGFASAAALAAAAGKMGLPARLLPPDAVTLERVDAALERLASAAPEARRQVLEAASAVVFSDGRLEAAEVELMRAVAAALGVPMPPGVAYSPNSTGQEELS